MYYCDTLHTSICFPYNGGHRRGLQTHLMLSTRFLERIFQSDHCLFAPPTGSLKINTNRTLFSSTNFGEHIYLNLALYYNPLTLYVKRMIQICTITFIYSFYSCALFLLFIRNLCCYTHHSMTAVVMYRRNFEHPRPELRRFHTYSGRTAGLLHFRTCSDRTTGLPRFRTCSDRTADLFRFRTCSDHTADHIRLNHMDYSSYYYYIRFPHKQFFC